MTGARWTALALTTVLGFAHASGQTPSLRLAHAFGLDGAVSFGELADGALAPDGSVALVDQANFRVYRFTTAGVLRDSMGGEGDGPGELRLPAHVVILSDGQIVVGDIGRRALIRWNAQGRLLRETRVTPWMLDLFGVGTELILESLDWRTDTIQVFRFGAAGPVPAAPQMRYLLPHDRALGRRLGDPEGAFLVGDNGRTLVAATDTFYRITELNTAGLPIRSWSRPDYPVVRWTEAERAQIRDQAARFMAGSTEKISTNEDAFQTKFTIPTRGISLDGQGRLWVMPQFTGDRPRQVDVFAESGHLLATLRLAGRPSHMTVRGDRLLAWGETEDGEPAAWLYRIQQ